MKKILFILSLYSIFNSQFSHAQITFEKTYGAGVGNFVQQTSDSGYIVIGDSVTSPTSSVLHLLKTDAYGYTLWTKNYGGTGEYDNSLGYCIRQTSDGGYIAAAYVGIFGGFCIIKLDVNGDTVWTRYFIAHGTASVQQTTDGGYIIAGGDSTNNGDAGLVKTDANGYIIWTKHYGGTGIDGAAYVDTTSDGGYILTGIYDQNGANNGDVYLIRTDANGDTLWTKTFGGTGSDVGNSVQQTSDGGFIIGGSTDSFGIWNGYYLIKTDENGDTLFTKTFYGGSCVARQTTDGGYIIAGGQSYIDSSQVYNRVLLIRTDSNGDSLWAKTFWNDSHAGPTWIEQTMDGGLVFTGEVTSIVFLIKTDSNGYVVGITEDFTQQNNQVTIFPNPFSTSAMLVIASDAQQPLKNTQIIFYDIIGSEVRKIHITDYKLQIDRKNLKAGMYFFKVVNDNEIIDTGKFIIE